MMMHPSEKRKETGLASKFFNPKKKKKKANNNRSVA